MGRRKQECPQRKWELEQALAAANAANADPAAALLLARVKKEDSGSENDDVDGEKSGSESGGDSPGSNSRSPNKSPSPGPLLNGAVLDFSQTRRKLPHISSRRHQNQILPPEPISGGECPLDLSCSTTNSSPSYLLPSKHLLPQHHTHHKDEPPKKMSRNWNGNSIRSSPPDMSSKALEKMSELSRVGQHRDRDRDREHRSEIVSPRNNSSSSWQAQWLAQSSCGTRDVLRCVCCRLTFPSLSALSAHMKESKHGPPIPNLPSPKGGSMPPQQSPTGLPQQPTAAQREQHREHLRERDRETRESNRDIHDTAHLLKETVHLPRKLVRGQDVWLGKGAEQTRQILKCMWCGQSFRTLADMTSHMQETQHYTNIISQEQLISWRSSEDKSTSPNSHVSAVLTCKVCDQAFSSLKELSNHMVKNSHYKEHIMRSITESGSRRRQSREKRKKSLPVRKLLELERANQEIKKDVKISCEKCSEKISASVFVEHLRICEKSHSNSHTSSTHSTTIKSPASSASSTTKGIKSEPNSPKDLSLNSSSNSNNNSKEKSPPISPGSGSIGSGGKEKKFSGSSESSSVLNAIEKMIEKSFDFSRKGPMNNSGSSGLNPVGTSILKRLGIDESVDYTKPLVDLSVYPLPPRYPSSRPRSVSSEKSSIDDMKAITSGGPTPSPLSEVNIKEEPMSPRRTPTKSPNNSVDSGDLEMDKKSIKSEKDTSISSSTSNSKKDKEKNSRDKKPKINSLSALSSMFDNIGGGNSGGNGSHKSDGGGSSHRSDGGRESVERKTPTPNNFSGNNSHHPLAALQKLCDKTENTPQTVSSRPTSTSSSNAHSSPGVDGSSILGLNCNWSTSSEGENVLKCTFCDTPFLSKGAYRHHLAKMHFVKEKSPNNNTPSTPKEEPADSPTSKFIKYTELAKQLSSK